MAQDYRFVKVFGERNTGMRALIRMLAAQPEVRMVPAGGGGTLRRPENDALRQAIEGAYKGKWRKVYRDALRDNEQAVASPVRDWKHALPVWDEAYTMAQAHVVFCVRNPYSWVLSLARRPYHQKGPKTARLLDFVTQPWLTVARDNMPAVLGSPMELWNEKVAAYGEFARLGDVPMRVIGFERFVANPVSEVQGMLAGFGIPSGEIRAVPSTKDAARLADIATYYAREDWKGALSFEVVEAINASLDWGVAAQHGYYRLEPSEFPRQKLTWKNLSRSRSLMLHSGSRLRNARQSVLGNSRLRNLSGTAGRPDQSGLSRRLFRGSDHPWLDRRV